MTGTESDLKRVLVVRPTEPGLVEIECTEIPDTLEALQGLVGGSIEGWSFGGGLMLICRSEGRDAMPRCFFHRRLGAVHGTSVIHSLEGEDIGRLVPLHVSEVLASLFCDDGLMPDADSETISALLSCQSTRVTLRRRPRR